MSLCALLTQVEYEHLPMFFSLRGALPPTTSQETELERSCSSASQISGNVAVSNCTRVCVCVLNHDLVIPRRHCISFSLLYSNANAFWVRKGTRAHL